MDNKQLLSAIKDLDLVTLVEFYMGAKAGGEYSMDAGDELKEILNKMGDQAEKIVAVSASRRKDTLPMKGRQMIPFSAIKDLDLVTLVELWFEAKGEVIAQNFDDPEVKKIIFKMTGDQKEMLKDAGEVIQEIVALHKPQNPN
jgi:hypothetical protein